MNECKPLAAGRGPARHLGGPPHLFYRGRVVHVDPMKTTLKPPGSKRWKLEHGELLSNFAFNLNLRRYTVAVSTTITDSGMFEAGAYTRPLSSSTLAPFVGYGVFMGYVR